MKFNNHVLTTTLSRVVRGNKVPRVRVACAVRACFENIFARVCAGDLFVSPERRSQHGGRVVRRRHAGHLHAMMRPRCCVGPPSPREGFKLLLLGQFHCAVVARLW